MPVHSLQRQLGELVEEQQQKALEKENLFSGYATKLFRAGSNDDEDREVDVMYRLIDRRASPSLVVSAAPETRACFAAMCAAAPTSATEWRCRCGTKRRR